MSTSWTYIKRNMHKLYTLFIMILSTSTVMAVEVSVTVIHARCGNDNGKVISSVSGGIPPYTYVWNTGSTENQLIGVPEGLYTVTVTDGQGETAEASGTVQQIFELAPTNGSVLQEACDGNCSGYGQFSTVYLGGVAPYTVDYLLANEMPGGFMVYGLCPDVLFDIPIEDANGCPGVISFPYINSYPIGYPDIEATSPACGVEANGTITMGYPGPGQAGFRVIGAGIDSIYSFMDSPYVITGLTAGNYEVWYWDPWSNEYVYCTGGTEVSIGTLDEPCGEVHGRVFHDADQDCVFNNDDLPLPNRVLTIGPDEMYVITDGEGYYSRALALGSYTLLQSLDDVEQHCPTDVPVPFTLTELEPSQVIDLADSSTVPHDIELLIIHTIPARPGFPTMVKLRVRNNSAYPTGALSIDLQYDPLLTDPAPANAQWTSAGIAPYSQQYFTFNAMVPADITLLGTDITYTATVTNTVYEPNEVNNTASVIRTITGSYDPNDKAGITNGSSNGSHFFLNEDEWIDYTIRFQNTGTDTAFTVVVRDTLEMDLDIMSLDILGSSHTFNPSFEEGRTLAFTFENILLPDSTTDLLGSQGFISYRIKPVNSIMIGDVIENTAGIYFDFNPPIITNTTAHVVESSTGVAERDLSLMSVYPNPANRTIVMQLTGATHFTAVEVFTTDGRLIALPWERNDRSCTMDIHSLDPGAYIVKVQHSGGSSTARFVKH